jgi:dipeptidyl aminopeptidase/acylaminoacyl peptidase
MQTATTQFRRKVLATLSLLAALACPLSAAAKRTLTIDDLINLLKPADPVISPDGRFVAYMVQQPNWAENRYDWQIWLANTQTGDLTQLTNSKRTNTDAAWSPDGRWLGFLSDRDGKRQIYIISPQGGEARRITDTEVGVSLFRWSPDGTRIAFTTLDPETEKDKRRRERYSDFEVVREYRMDQLWLTDLSGRTPRRLTQGNQYTVHSFSWSPDGRRIAFDAQVTPAMSSDETANVYVLNLDDNSVRKLIDEPGPDRNPKWSPDGKQIVFETAMGKPHYFTQNISLAVVSAEGGAVSNLTADFDERASFVAWAPEGIYFTAAQKTATHMFRVDPKSRKIERVSPLEDAAYESFSFTGDFQQVAFTEADSTHFPEVYVSSVKNFAPKRLTNFAEQLKDFKLATRETISWKNADGMTIEGALMKPPDFDPAKKHPLLVVIHGGPADTSQAIFGVYDFHYYPKEIWAAKGALILEPNYRGSNGYGIGFHRLTVRTQGFGDYEDIISGVDSLIAKGWVDKDRVGAMGWSFGGFISAWLTTHSDRFKAISAGAAPTDWVMFDAFTDIQEISRHYFATAPWSDPDIYRNSSPITNVKQAKTPTMIEHGEFDPIVPIAGAYELYQGLLDQGVPVRFYLYKGFGHSITRPKSNRAVMQHNLNWFNHYIWGEPDEDDAK